MDARRQRAIHWGFELASDRFWSAGADTHMSMTPELSIVIPAYNEEGRLPRTLDRIFSYLESRRIDFEVIVVSDGSSDGTAALVRRPGRNLAQPATAVQSNQSWKGLQRALREC